ncbi:unnamed protein product [Owenia fusiformis]|uniref:Carbonic anhydrase n=1 Tax=Owenia fusiformis TaxID=6347 RepID=A0A8J1UDJ3_OWEFU|nr:unnamed protein product [Owenia fusiformis]
MPGLQKVLKGVLQYRELFKSKMVEKLVQISEHPQPTALLFTCMDTRLQPSVITMSNPGDMFVVRNAGNMVPHSDFCSYDHITTEPGALELACIHNPIRHVIVCGHSDCKAINLLLNMRDKKALENKDGTPLENWVKKHGLSSVMKFEQLENLGDKGSGPIIFQGASPKHTFEAFIDPQNEYSILDKLSQVHCLQQLQNIASQDFLKEKLSKNEVHLHAMWYDMKLADMLIFSRQRKQFVTVNEDNYLHLLEDSMTMPDHKEMEKPSPVWRG